MMLMWNSFFSSFNNLPNTSGLPYRAKWIIFFSFNNSHYFLLFLSFIHSTTEQKITEMTIDYDFLFNDVRTKKKFLSCFEPSKKGLFLFVKKERKNQLIVGDHIIHFGCKWRFSISMENGSSIHFRIEFSWKIIIVIHFGRFFKKKKWK